MKNRPTYFALTKSYIINNRTYVAATCYDLPASMLAVVQALADKGDAYLFDEPCVTINGVPKAISSVLNARRQETGISPETHQVYTKPSSGFTVEVGTV